MISRCSVAPLWCRPSSVTGRAFNGRSHIVFFYELLPVVGLASLMVRVTSIGQPPSQFETTLLSHGRMSLVSCHVCSVE
jgi:hypothetical protein